MIHRRIVVFYKVLVTSKEHTAATLAPYLITRGIYFIAVSSDSEGCFQIPTTVKYDFLGDFSRRYKTLGCNKTFMSYKQYKRKKVNSHSRHFYEILLRELLYVGGNVTALTLRIAWNKSWNIVERVSQLRVALWIFFWKQTKLIDQSRYPNIKWPKPIFSN